MLFKRIIANFGRSLAGEASRDDPVAMRSSGSGFLSTRQSVVEALSAARVYSLDAGASSYIDALQSAVTHRGGGDADPAADFINSIDLPTGVMWVEYSEKDIIEARIRQGITLSADVALADAMKIGVLLDNRQEDLLSIWIFLDPSDGPIIDPLVHFNVKKCARGRALIGSSIPVPHDYMVRFCAFTQVPDDFFANCIREEINSFGYTVFIPFALTSLLESRKADFRREETAFFTSREEKAARKFGKTWLIDAPRTYLTVRIGPEVETRLRTHEQRSASSRREIAERLAPTRHWVSEHERHYRSGRVAIVRGHHRGQEPDPLTPTLVVGPRTVAPQEVEDWPEPEF